MTDFLQYLVAGIALGFQYALVALGFVVIYKATSVLNFAQGAFVMLGAYLTYQFGQVWDLPFPLAVLCAIVATGLVGVAIERTILRRMVGRPAFALIMITFGLVFVISELTATIWGVDNLNLGDPWGIDTVNVGGVVIRTSQLWGIALAGVVVVLFFAFFRFSKLGLAMRASALDQEAAMAQGMSANRVVMAAWAISGGVAALAGVILASGPANVTPSLQFFALLALPAIILGGVDSPGGAVLGGVIIGLTQTLTAGYQNQWAPFLGANFQTVMPYVVMVLLLLVRPYGLFGTREVKRI